MLSCVKSPFGYIAKYLDNNGHIVIAIQHQCPLFAISCTLELMNMLSGKSCHEKSSNTTVRKRKAVSYTSV